MTRINCVPVEELHQKHLVAEYRELPRVFKLAEAAAKRGGHSAPANYTLGAGHVKFFYTHLGYCQQRFKQLVAEMVRRGYNPQHTECPISDALTIGCRTGNPPTSICSLIVSASLIGNQSLSCTGPRARLLSTRASRN